MGEGERGEQGEAEGGGRGGNIARGCVRLHA